MQVNWSLILNILLLVGVVIAIGRLIKTRQRSVAPVAFQPSLGPVENKYLDDIIAVRKVNYDLHSEPNHLDNIVVKSTNSVKAPLIEKNTAKTRDQEEFLQSKPLMMFLLAKEQRQLAGYELLQTVLAAGLRFGENHLFHRHQRPNGQGPILCSLAAATASGRFDLQNIGAFSVRGLCLFMHPSGNATIDMERFNVMYDTAKQLCDGLDTYLLDDQRQPISESSLLSYQTRLTAEEKQSVEA